MKTKLLKALLILFLQTAIGIAINPFRECILDTNNEINREFMQTFDPTLSCRQGQVLLNKTFDEIIVKYCCDVTDISAVQTASESSRALECNFNSDGSVRREDLLVHGSDLYCEAGFKLTSFDIKFNCSEIKASCCAEIKTQQEFEPFSKKIFSWIFKKFKFDLKYENPLVRVRRQISEVKVAAAECIFEDGGKSNPIEEYMSYDEGSLTCRVGQIILNSTRGGAEVYCCRYSSTSTLTAADVPKVIASRCVFEGSDPIMWSMHTPGGDLVCKDPELYEVVSLSTTHLVTGKSMVMSCCKKIESTTTTPFETTTKGTTPYKPPFPYLDGEVCLKAGNDCVYQNDGSVKINYMDFEAKAAYCRPGQSTKLEIDSKNRRRICCEPSTSAPSITLPPLCPSICAFDDDEDIPKKWSMLTYSPDLICKGANVIHTFDMPDGKKCCCAPPLTTTTTTTPQTPETTLPTTPNINEPQSALSVCYFNFNRELKTELMEVCKPSKKCRTNEVMLNQTVNGKNLCCCDERKELPPPTEKDPKLIALKCYYDLEGNVIPFTTLTAGLDLICPTSDQMMTYTDEKNPASCCKLKSMTTIQPKTVPPGNSTSIDIKVIYSECSFKSDGKLDSSSLTTCNEKDKTCRQQYKVKTHNITTSINKIDQKCCCEVDKSFVASSTFIPVYAPVCSTKEWSMVKSGLDLTCKPNFRIYTVTKLDQNGVLASLSCCLQVDQDLPNLVLQDKINFVGPRCTFTEKKEIEEIFMENCAENMVCRGQDKMVNKTVKDLATNLDVRRCCCEFDPKLPPKENKSPVRAHDCYFDYFGYIVMNSLVPYGKDLECQKNFNLVNYTLDVESKPTVFSCCFPDGLSTVPSSPYFTTIPTKFSTTTKKPFGKRTPKPKKNPGRILKPGDCPDCIMPSSLKAADINWVIAHLVRPGPPVGFCPSGYTMRRIYPVQERRDLTATKCCCESNAFPLPVKLGG